MYIYTHPAKEMIYLRFVRIKSLQCAYNLVSQFSFLSLEVFLSFFFVVWFLALALRASSVRIRTDLRIQQCVLNIESTLTYILSISYEGKWTSPRNCTLSHLQ